MLFYIAGRSAFARDNEAAIASFGHEGSVSAKLAGPRGVTATDHFSLQGLRHRLCGDGEGVSAHECRAPRVAPS